MATREDYITNLISVAIRVNKMLDNPNVEVTGLDDFYITQTIAMLREAILLVTGVHPLNIIRSSLK